MRRRMIWMVPAAIIGLLLFVVIGGELVRLLWNALLPPLFGWPGIGFWQALGLLALCRILFGGLGCHGGAGPRLRGRVADRMAERWAHMTPEERERFRQRVRERCGFDPTASEGSGQ